LWIGEVYVQRKGRKVKVISSVREQKRIIQASLRCYFTPFWQYQESQNDFIGKELFLMVQELVSLYRGAGRFPEVGRR
jgi:hypothetical protein